MGNTVVWKPASSAVYSAWHILKLLEAAGLPPGVINFVPGLGPRGGRPGAREPRLRRHPLHRLDRRLPGDVADDRREPRAATGATRASSGETGGKDFVFAHPSADVDALAAALVRGAFEYQGQKCSAASRAYVPESLWPQLKERLLGDASAELKVGDRSRTSRKFMGAVIDRGAFENDPRVHRASRARSSQATILAGGELRRREGLLRRADRGRDGQPALPAHAGGDLRAGAHDLRLRRRPRSTRRSSSATPTSPYALTGAVFARDRAAVERLDAAARGRGRATST